MIKKTKKGYRVVSEDGSKNLGGPYKSRKQAVKRLQQVEYFKHNSPGRSATKSPRSVRSWG